MASQLLTDEIKGLKADLEEVKHVRRQLEPSHPSYIPLTNEITETLKRLNLLAEQQQGDFTSLLRQLPLPFPILIPSPISFDIQSSHVPCLLSNSNNFPHRLLYYYSRWICSKLMGNWLHYLNRRVSENMWNLLPIVTESWAPYNENLLWEQNSCWSVPWKYSRVFCMDSSRSARHKGCSRYMSFRSFLVVFLRKISEFCAQKVIMFRTVVTLQTNMMATALLLLQRERERGRRKCYDKSQTGP